MGRVRTAVPLVAGIGIVSFCLLEVFEGAPEAGAALITCTFEALEGDRARLAMRTAVDSKEIRDMIIGTGMESGAQEGLDILEEIAIELN